MTGQKNNFSLAELVLVAVVFAIIAALAVPAFQRARNASLNDRCAYNLDRIGNAMRLYYQDFRAFPLDFPAPVIYGMAHFQDSLICPADHRNGITASYGMNAEIAGKKAGELPEPSSLTVAADSDAPMFNVGDLVPAARHLFQSGGERRAIAVRMDGSVR
ncbi:MAG: type II secretion system protein [Victivallaceae bacterium]|nr:type II secretion system protein [Victivallaceae bacterium]